MRSYPKLKGYVGLKTKLKGRQMAKKLMVWVIEFRIANYNPWIVRSLHFTKKEAYDLRKYLAYETNGMYYRVRKYLPEEK